MACDPSIPELCCDDPVPGWVKTVLMPYGHQHLGFSATAPDKGPGVFLNLRARYTTPSGVSEKVYAYSKFRNRMTATTITGGTIGFDPFDRGFGFAFPASENVITASSAYRYYDPANGFKYEVFLEAPWGIQDVVDQVLLPTLAGIPDPTVAQSISYTFFNTDGAPQISTLGGFFGYPNVKFISSGIGISGNVLGGGNSGDEVKQCAGITVRKIQQVLTSSIRFCTGQFRTGELIITDCQPFQGPGAFVIDMPIGYPTYNQLPPSLAGTVTSDVLRGAWFPGFVYSPFLPNQPNPPACCNFAP